tara:strand:+ start:323 stop:484 length:162 start_codon:yes stop_codon:yes gene_type:complete
MNVKDMGDLCLECRQDTSWGSGRFVNRIPAGQDFEIGYLCAECYEVDFKEEEE